MGSSGPDIELAARRVDDVPEIYAQMQTVLGPEDAISGRLAAWFKTQNRRDEARAIYNRFINQVEGQSQIALMHREEKQFDQAVAVSQNANGWQWQIGHIYRDFGRLKEAIVAFRQCNNFPEAYQQMAWCHRGLKEYKEAILLYNQIVASHPPTAAWALLQIGYTQEQAGEKETAIKMFQQVCKRYPKSGQASEAHAHLNEKYRITVTLGGATADQ